jgi:hypothetical protein
MTLKCYALLLNVSKYTYFTDGTTKPFFFVYSWDKSLEVFRTKLATDVAINQHFK